MKALDPIDVMRVKTGYYSHLDRGARERFPVPVVLSWDAENGGDSVDTAASRQAFELELNERLQAEFPEAMEIAIVCADGEEPRPTLTEVSLTRPDDERLSIAVQWVDALTKLVWARGQWLAPRE